MDLNISGLLLPPDFGETPEAILQRLGWTAAFVREVSLKKAIAGWDEEVTYADFVRGKAGTLILVNELDELPTAVFNDGTGFSFSLSETANIHLFTHYAAGAKQRERMTSENAVLLDRGTPLPLELAAGGAKETILAELAALLGRPLRELDPMTRCLRYRLD
ncbi:MAG: hypothetical protein WBA17_18485 [Saprospiraceae bacterium]